jgi:hypothetical protein
LRGQSCIIRQEKTSASKKNGAGCQAVQKIQPPASAGYEGLLFPPEQSAKIQKAKSLKASVNSNGNFPIFWRITPRPARNASASGGCGRGAKTPEGGISR